MYLLYLSNDWLRTSAFSFVQGLGVVTAVGLESAREVAHYLA